MESFSILLQRLLIGIVLCSKLSKYDLHICLNTWYKTFCCTCVKFVHCLVATRELRIVSDGFCYWNLSFRVFSGVRRVDVGAHLGVGSCVRLWR